MPPRRTRPAAAAATAVVVLAMLASAASTVCADDLAAEPGPWHAGVSDADKRAARALYRQGTAHHRRLELAEARAKYQAALSRWEHPVIWIQLGKVLHLMGLPLESHAALRRALQWGRRRLPARERDEAEALIRKLEARELAAIEARCDEPGAAVSLNGKPWFVGPGVERRMVRAGEHVVSGSKPGYVAETQAVLLLPGHVGTVAVRLGVDRVVIERRWRSWSPWAVFGVGAASALAGALLIRSAEGRYQNVADQLDAQCGSSCAPTVDPPGLARARWDDRTGTAALIVGGAAAGAGLILLVLNRPRTSRLASSGGIDFDVRPLLSPSDTEVVVTILF